MPTVPTTFVPDTNPQGGGDIGQYQAANVVPVEDFTGQQVARLGQAMVGAGNAAFRLGSSIQDGIDDAATREADVRASRGMQAIADQYLATNGKDSETSFQPTLDAMSQAASEAMDGLQNDTQRRMFSPVVSKNLGMFESSVRKHRTQQVSVYETRERVARSEVNADNAIFAYSMIGMKDQAGRDVGMLDYIAYADSAIDEAEQAGRLMGYGKDSAQMGQLKSTVHDRIAKGVIEHLMTKKNYAAAGEFLKDASTAEALSPKTLDALSESVDANSQRSVVSELTTNIMETGRLVSQSDPTQYPDINSDTDGRPEGEREALAIAKKIEDSETRKYVQSELRTRYAQDKALAEREYRSHVETVDQFLAVPGNGASNMPDGMFGGLRPEDRKRVMAGQRESDELVVLAELAQNPALVLAPDWLETHRDQLTPKTFVILLNERNKPERVFAATFDADQLNTTLLNNGFDKYVNPQDDDKHMAIRLHNLVKTEIDLRQRQTGRLLDKDGKQKIMDEIIMDKVSVSKWWSSDPEVMFDLRDSSDDPSLYVMVGGRQVMLKDIPGDSVVQIRASLSNSGLPTDWKSIAEAWVISEELQHPVKVAAGVRDYGKQLTDHAGPPMFDSPLLRFMPR